MDIEQIVEQEKAADEALETIEQEKVEEMANATSHSNLTGISKPKGFDLQSILANATG